MGGCLGHSCLLTIRKSVYLSAKLSLYDRSLILHLIVLKYLTIILLRNYQLGYLKFISFSTHEMSWIISLKCDNMSDKYCAKCSSDVDHQDLAIKDLYL